ncbi:hypothetical protein AB432_009030 [Brevibacillus brevis]|uniref:Uncharacterized protein n=1 Tax=Brevibacillus brevis TaxID=1393 RepID=A0A2Z4MFF7_BREBE|nr:hypothetical protein [Brevibacillus brevis]AWX55174.1 hypothetical protein AB432_009030 [Brevibacillus brevis]
MDQVRLDYLIRILQEEVRNGRIQIADSETIDAFMRIAYLPDGKSVDSSTVDGRIRALALTVEIGKYQQQLLEVPLRESQEQYFNILEHFFGNPYREMKRYNVTPHEVAVSMSQTPDIVKSFQNHIESFESGLRELWGYYAPIIQAHVRQLKGIRSIFGGDIFPSYIHNIAHSSGLYIDTIILPDPLLRSCTFFKAMPADRAFYYLSKHALNALQYKDLALADVDVPIVIIAPDSTYLDENGWDILSNVSQQNVTSHINKMFNKRYSTTEQIEDFLQGIHTTEDLLKSINDTNRLLFDTAWTNEPLELQIQRWQQNNPVHVQNSGIGNQLGFQVVGRMMQANDLVARSLQFDGTPIIDAPTSWQYLLWKYEYDAQQNTRPELLTKDVLVSNALTNINLPIIGNLTDTSIIQLRKEGALQELRDIIAKGIDDVSHSTEDSFNIVTEHVISNLKEVFDEHQKTINDLNIRQKKFYGLDLLPLLVSGGLGIAAACTGNPLITSLAAVSTTVFGAPSVKEVLKTGTELSKVRQEVTKSPVGILIKHSR